MNRTEQITINKKNFEIYSMTTRQSIAISNFANKNNMIETIKRFVELHTSLDKGQLNEMLFSDVITLLIHHRHHFYSDLTLNKETNILPSQFVHLRENTEQITHINSIRYTNQITFKKVEMAYSLAIMRQDMDILNLYILGSGCLKRRLDTGIDNILETIASKEKETQLVAHSTAVKSVGNTRLDLTTDTAKIYVESESHKIELNGSFFLSGKKQN